MSSQLLQHWPLGSVPRPPFKPTRPSRTRDPINSPKRANLSFLFLRHWARLKSNLRDPLELDGSWDGETMTMRRKLSYSTTRCMEPSPRAGTTGQLCGQWKLGGLGRHTRLTCPPSVVIDGYRPMPSRVSWSAPAGNIANNPHPSSAPAL